MHVWKKHEGGCTITGEASSLLITAVELLDGVEDELMKNIPDEGK